MAQYDRDTMLSRLALTARKASYLTKEEEYQLLESWIMDRDDDALNQLSLSHSRLVIAQALRFRSFGVPLSDLIQEGHMGLMEAANRFNLSKDVRFATYAMWWIKSFIQDFVLRNQSIVRSGTSSRQKRLFFGYKRMHADAAAKHPDLCEEQLHHKISKKTGIKVNEISMMSARLKTDTSLNAAIKNSDAKLELQDTIATNDPLPDEIVELQLDAERSQRKLNDALGTLLPREQRVIRDRKLKEERITLEALGKELGVSKERVRQIEVKAMDKLRLALVLTDAQ
ncbi:RNA polymerase sigma factor RpoH [Pseudovibrio axinellae]|uniref:RNA polymerase sigma factor RpoH n=1 Tax=Pseudovibrio axinellae TaxID=989403 RepID=A0A166A6Q0_9HYPH|nr:sigma-70 family RNA polymerase sigma factor [Pseudovibrio axinellae]KZL20678.1 RNA polymerase sigma factor RpoH [Pseudovibrio axinellae]SER25946.1 RNA polymerase, sigma 32 subunit, RpoH [Pseudovibrio axinellae]